MAFLSLPDVKYRDTFLAGLAEYHAESRHLEMDARMTANEFEGFVRGLQARADGKRLPYGWVPSIELWLMDEDEYVGTSHIRPRLNEQLRRYGGNIGYEIRPSRRRQGYGTAILRLTLQWAGRMGMERALVTCNRDNTGSRRIIEANGGVFEGESPVNVGSGVILERRYWISIASPDDTSEQ
jgi:predicted acetyltransferase